MPIQIAAKRIYEPYSKNDGYRILVDRLWPRGISKERAHVDLWFKEITPSTELRQWYHSHPEKFVEFKERYVAELEQHGSVIKEFIANNDKKRITLLYASKISENNHAVVIKEYLEKFL